MRVRHLTTLAREDAASLGVSGNLRPWGIDADSSLPDWADAACRAWGFFGVASRHGDEVDGIILVAPESIKMMFLGGEYAPRSWQHA